MSSNDHDSSKKDLPDANQPIDTENSSENPSEQKTESEVFDPVTLGEYLFRFRDYTPIPLLVLMLVVASPSNFSTTLGTALVIFGELLRIYSVSFIGSISRTRSDNLGAKLITNGPFRYVRNPLYVGNFFITIGFALYSGEPIFLAIAALLFAFQYYNIVRYEEKLLRDRFGEEFVNYCNEVPAWFPKRLPALDQIEWPINLSYAFKSEKRTFLAILGVFILLFLVGR